MLSTVSKLKAVYQSFCMFALKEKLHRKVIMRTDFTAVYCQKIKVSILLNKVVAQSTA